MSPTTDLAKPAKPAETFLPISGSRKVKDKAAAVHDQPLYR